MSSSKPAWGWVAPVMLMASQIVLAAPPSDEQKFMILAEQLDRQQKEIKQLRAQVEALSRAVDQGQKPQRVTTAAPAAPHTPPVSAKSAAVPTKLSSDKAEYDAAMKLHQKGEHPAAAVAFHAFIDHHPTSRLKPNALYWQGLSLAASQHCTESIVIHRKLVSSFPDSPKAPDALRSVAHCQEEKGDKTAARGTLEQLIAKYPVSEAATQAKRQLAKLK